MITLPTQLHVEGLTAKAAFEFLLNAEHRDFQTWWPGVHLQLRNLRRYPNHIGNLVYLDQIIGDYRVRVTELIVAAIPHRRIMRQIIYKGVRLPVQIAYDFEDDDLGVTVSHTIYAGFSGFGRMLDPAFRLYFTRRFNAAIDEHVRAEFVLLRDLPVRV